MVLKLVSAVITLHSSQVQLKFTYSDLFAMSRLVMNVNGLLK